MFKKPTTKGITENAIDVGGLAAGAALSRGVVSIIEAKLPQYAKFAKGAVAVGGIVLASSTSNSFVKGAGQGMAVMQGLNLVTDVVAGTSIGQELALSTDPIKNAAAKTLGLACACDTQPVYHGGYNMSSRIAQLNAVQMQNYGAMPMISNSNPFGA